MLNRFTTRALIITLVVTLGETSAFAESTTTSVVNSNPSPAPTADQTVTALKRNQKLNAELEKLVAAAKAARVIAAPRTQLQPETRNSLSKGKKLR